MGVDWHANDVKYLDDNKETRCKEINYLANTIPLVRC